MKKGRGSHVPTPSGRHRAQAGVQGEEAKPSLDAGEHDGVSRQMTSTKERCIEAPIEIRARTQENVT
ncbi:hypothetical protein U91I_02593 [alpha proteobacterium U9-1i]|nr:hypothetical protein U91I_02593 [alpha proteobacterium U9-1i]